MKRRKDIIDVTGQRFSDFTVLEYAGKLTKRRGAFWKCLCVCGKICIVPGGHLRAGMRKSCGCRSQARIFEVGINRLYSGYKRMAKRRNHFFDLSRDYFEKLVTGNCNYCGVVPSQELKRMKSLKIQILYNGIDRFNPKLGYIKENTVSCCYYCNHAKADLTFIEWTEQLKRTFKFQGFTNGI